MNLLNDTLSESGEGCSRVDNLNGIPGGTQVDAGMVLISSWGRHNTQLIFVLDVGALVFPEPNFLVDRVKLDVHGVVVSETETLAGRVELLN